MPQSLLDVLESNFPNISLSVMTSDYFPPSPLLKMAQIDISNETELCDEKSGQSRLQESIQGSPNLRSFWFSSYTNRTCHDSEPVPVISTTSQGVMPSLEELSLYGQGFTSQDIGYWTTIVGWNTLKVLNLGIFTLTGPLLTSLAPVSERLPKLEDLRLSIPEDEPTIAAIGRFFSSMKEDTLESLGLWGKYRTGAIADHIISAIGPRLNSLTLLGNPEEPKAEDFKGDMLSATQLLEISARCPKLKTLAIDFTVFENRTWVSFISLSHARFDAQAQARLAC